MNESILPSKQFIITVVIITVVLGGGTALFLSTRESASKFFAESKEKEMRQIAENLIASDEDEDGLLDWEESLWKTDVKNADTDGDGTTDGEEIRIGRDPLKSAPGDEITVERIEVFRDSAIADAEGKNSNLTATFAKNFFIEYAKTKEAGLPVGIMGTSIERVEELLPPEALEERPPLFSEADILTTSSTDNNALRVYANAVGTAFAEHPIANEEIVTLFYRALRSGSRTELTKLTESGMAVGAMGQDIIAIPVPSTLIKEHTALLNALAEISETFLTLGNAYEDPLGATYGIVQYLKSAKKLNESVIKIGTTLNSRNVTFGKNDPGYMFPYIVTLSRNN